MKHRTALCFACVFAMSVVLGCASTPQADPNAPPEVKVRLVPERDLARHGVSFTEDPLVVPLQFLSVKQEFVVVSIYLSLPRATRVTIDADVKAENGDIVAKLYSLDEMRDFWSNRSHTNDPALPRRLQVLDKWYAPSFNFTARKGHREYYVVCVGKNPIHRPSDAEVFVSLDEGELQSFYLPLPVKGK